MTDEELKNLLASYHPSDSVVDLVKRAKLLLLVGISGAGKDTIKQELLKQPDFYNFVSHTTRAPRSNHGLMEQDGVDYHFISKDTAVKMLQNGEFIEAKQYSANIYGTTAEGLRPSVEDGMVAVNDVEVQGVDEYKKMSEAVMAVFILPPSYEEWQSRLSGRYAGGDVDADDMELRFKTAEAELAFALKQGYFKFVINDTLEQATADIDDIVTGSYDTERQEEAIALARTLLSELGTH